MSELPEVNQELFGTILDQIREHPEQHEQQDWQIGGFPGVAECDTTRCIGGWAIFFATNGQSLYSSARFELAGKLGCGSAPSDMAQKLLGLTDIEANDLFYVMTNRRAVRAVELYALKGREWQGVEDLA